MTIDKIINTTEKTELEIIGTTLLSIEEAKKLPEKLREYKNWWWLRSRGNHQDFAAVVRSNGSISCGGIIVGYGLGYVRPALIIDLNSSNLGIGDCFYFKDKEFEIISDDLALCKTDIGYHRFDKETGIYENSKVKEYINNWFKN